MCHFNMRKYTCGHSDVGDRIRDCDLRRLQNKECNRYIITPETIVETDPCATCKEGDTSVHAHYQDSTHPNVVSPSASGFECQGRLSVEKNYKHPPPRIRSARGCKLCRRRKIRCDLAEPQCGSCTRLGRECSRDLVDESLKLTEEESKPEQARFLGSEQSLIDEDPRPSSPRLPNLSASPKIFRTTSQSTRPVPGLAHNLSLSPRKRKRLPAWGPQHAGHGQLTDGILSVTALQPLQTYGATPLRTLLAKYYLLDAISQVRLENVNSCLDVVHTEPPIRPLAESVAWLYAKPPRVWLAIRRMIRNLYTDVLHDILDIISDAKLYTDHVLSHTPSRPTLGPIEQGFACPALFDCVRVRQYMLNMLFREVHVFILELSRPRVDRGKESNPDAPSPSDRQSSAKSVTIEEGRTQAARDSKRWLLATSQRMWDRILHPTVQGKRRNRAVDALMLTKRSKLNCDGLQQTLRVIAIYSLPLILATYSCRISRVWLKISIFKDGTFSRLMDLQDRRYPFEADDREYYAQDFLFAP